ncbi:hypothetical protein [Rhizobium phage RHph_X2_25]|nr:hypothetical protein [Rhizobium phage RHph_X2_25]
MEFALGQCVNHKSGNMPSIVVGRSRTERGREQYLLRQLNIKPERHRVMRGDVLVPMSEDSPECMACRRRGICPMPNPLVAASWSDAMSFNGIE